MSTPTIQPRREYVFAMLPPWMHEAYNNDPLINQAIKRALDDGADSAGDVALHVSKALHEHSKAMQAVMVREAQEWNGRYAMKTEKLPNVPLKVPDGMTQLQLMQQLFYEVKQAGKSDDEAVSEVYAAMGGQDY